VLFEEDSNDSEAAYFLIQCQFEFVDDRKFRLEFAAGYGRWSADLTPGHLEDEN
jgi:hypothetical protein